MIFKLLSEHHLEFLSLKGSCRGSSESTHVKLLEISCRGSIGLDNPFNVILLQLDMVENVTCCRLSSMTR